MTSRVKNIDSKTVIQFPVMARNKKDDFIVLFRDINDGTVIRDSHMFNLGYYSEAWSPVFDETVWELLPEGTEVILKQ